MGCNGFRKQFSAYVDGTLDPRRRASLERHLRACPECEADLRTLSRTVSILRALDAEEPPEAARELLRRKIQSVRQPLTWRESLRLSWNAGQLKAQTRAWAFGLAVSGLLFFIGASLRETPHAPKSVPLTSWQVPSAVEPPSEDPGRPVGRVPAGGLAVRKFPESPLVAGQPALLYLSVAPLRPFSEVQVFIRPSFGVGIGGRAIPQADASYLLYRGPLAQETWVPVEIRPTTPGDCTLRLQAYARGRLLLDEEIPLHVAAR